MRRFFIAAISLASVLAFAPRARSQVVERTASWDSSGRVEVMTPALVRRLDLNAPAWPVRGDFVEARVYSSGDGYVIVVQRTPTELDRYPLTSDQFRALRSAVDAASARVGGVIGEVGATEISEPARGAFVRNQMLLAAFMYGPAVAALTHNSTAGAAAYLLTIGGSYFALTSLSKHAAVTKAQNDLATDGAIRWSLGLSGALHAAGVSLGGDWPATLTLAGGVGGSIVGYQVGTRLTDAEAQANMTGSTLAALTTLGIVGTTGLLDHDSTGRGVTAALVAGGIAGYAVGRDYPRRAGYRVTSGDIVLVRLSAYLGALAALTPLADLHHVDDRVGAAVATTGLVAGAYVGDRLLARPYDHTSGDAGLVELGAVAGGLMGLSLPVLMRSHDAAFLLGMGVGGAIVGTWGAEKLVEPQRSTPAQSRTGASRVRFTPEALALAATRRPGSYPLLSLRF